jgi:MFS family permease
MKHATGGSGRERLKPTMGAGMADHPRGGAHDLASAVTSSAEHWPAEQVEHRFIPERGRAHGKPSSWVLVGAVAAAFIAGGVALIIQSWWLFWMAVGVVVLAVPAGKAIHIMDDTVSWGANPAPGLQPERDSGLGGR